MPRDTRLQGTEDDSAIPPGSKPAPGHSDLPVEPDLGPTPPLSHPEEPGTIQPAL